MSRKRAVRPSIMDDPCMAVFEDHWLEACGIVVAIQHFVLGKNANVLREMEYLARDSSFEAQPDIRKAIRQLRKDGYGTAEDSKARHTILTRHRRRVIDAMGSASHALWQADEVIDPPEIPRHLRTVVLLDEYIRDLAAIVGRLIDSHGKNETTRLIWAMRAQDKLRDIDRILDRLRRSPKPFARPRKDGWSAAELYGNGKISPRWFGKFCESCPNLQRPESGHQEFRFSRGAVELLIKHARARGTPKLRAAADRWSAMLADSAA